MILIKCGECGKLIIDRAKSIYNTQVDKFYCNESCEKQALEDKNSRVPPIKNNNNGQLYWDFRIEHQSDEKSL
ncbi:hypothetical protein [Lysinibacillus xylanilyticus]|uniref:hypothetical protein n=1 Tax=Lysinibacillus xylanilyticus TaxID=582475 RepID=UPI003D08431A